MTDTRQVLDNFDPTITNDPVFVNIWKENARFAEDQESSYVIRALFLKSWCIHRLEKNCSEDNLAQHALTLDAAADAEYLDDQLADALENLSMEHKFKIDVADCVVLIKDLAATNADIKSRAGDAMQEMIKATGYEVPRICVSRQLADTARILQSTMTDAYYKQQPTFGLPYNLYQEFQVQVVTQLNLCGGTPLMTEPVNFQLNSRPLIVVGAFGTLLEKIRTENPLRLGILTQEIEEGGFWLFQSAENLSTLKEDDWVEVSADTIDEFKEEEDIVFAIHSRQLEMASAITKKIEDLQKNRGKWFQRREGRLFTRQEHLVPPHEYMPALSAAAKVQRPLTEEEKREAKKVKNQKAREKKKVKKQEAKKQATADQDVEMEG